AADSRDSTVAHSGDASLKLHYTGGTAYFYQQNLSLPAGADLMLNLWARPDGGSRTISVHSGATCYQKDMTTAETTSATTTLPASSTSWVQTPWFKFNVPGDSQYGRYTTTALRSYVS